jgi:hypothetical protein
VPRLDHVLQVPVPLRSEVEELRTAFESRKDAVSIHLFFVPSCFDSIVKQFQTIINTTP